MIVIKSILFEYNDNKLHFIQRFVDQCYKEIYPFRFEKCVSGAKKRGGVVQ